MNLKEMLAARPMIHRDGAGAPMYMGIADEVLLFLDEKVGPDAVTFGNRLRHQHAVFCA